MADPARNRPLRLMYAAGPGDVIGTWRHWLKGNEDPGQVSMTYSGQFYDVCKALGAKGYVIGSHPRRERVSDDQFVVTHRPIRFARGPAPLYHLERIRSGLRLTVSAIWHRADAVVVCDGTCHWFALGLMKTFGVKIIPTIHCVLWRVGSPEPGGLKKWISRFDSRFFRRRASAVMSASYDITNQLKTLTHQTLPPVVEFLPTYRAGTFDHDAPPPENKTPFRVLFAGRVESFKGVFDLFEIAKRFRTDGRDIEFDLCGNGSSLEALRSQVNAAGLADRFRLHGHCDRPTMKQMFQQSHALIVPTTTDFAEGFNQVVVEGVLAGRPVITSSVCPALNYVRDAVLEVPPNDVTAYQDAILKLKDDPALYEQKRTASLSLREQFYDVSKGWSATLTRALQLVGLTQ